MPAKDIYHDNCKQALIKDGWAISHDPYSLKIGKKDIFIDLAGEKLLTAEKDTKKIAVEIKSFVSPSEIRDLEVALGQYILYQNVLSRIEPERILYLAIRDASFMKLFEYFGISAKKIRCCCVQQQRINQLRSLVVITSLDLTVREHTC